MAREVDFAARARFAVWERESEDALRRGLMTGPAPDVDVLLARAVFAPTLVPAGAAAPEATAQLVDVSLAEAARKAPDDAAVAWMEATACPDTAQHCSRDGAMQRLIRLEPDNAAVWLLAAEWAATAGDTAALEAYLAQAGRTRRHDLHYGEGPNALLRALERVRIPPRSPEQEQAIRAVLDLPPQAVLSDDDVRTVWASMADAAWLPSFSGVARACHPDTTSQRAACIGAYTVMADSDTMAARAIALARMVQLTQGTDSSPPWRERFRRYLWLLDQGQPEPLTTYLRAWWAQGEAPAREAWWAAQGQAVPADWLPENPRYRAMVLGQPPPPPR